MEWARANHESPGYVVTVENNSDNIRYSPLRRLLGVLGDRIGCHQMPERSLFLCERQFPVCARCTGVFMGQLLCVGLLVAGIRSSCLLALTFMSVMFIDWCLQYFGLVESTNTRRLLTGLLGGYGYISIVYSGAGLVWQAMR